MSITIWKESSPYKLLSYGIILINCADINSLNLFSPGITLISCVLIFLPL